MMPYKQQVGDLDLIDVLKNLKRDVMVSLNCHAIGRISKFNTATQTADIEILYKKTSFVAGPDGKTVPRYSEYPVLKDCPVVVMGGGSVSLQMPIVAGDECLILFNDRSIDDWYQDGTSKPLTSPRTHSTADGIALVGVRSKQKAIASFDGTRAILTDGTVMVGLNPTTHKATIKNQTQSLGTILANILTQLETLANTVPVVATPLNPAVATALTTYATQLAALLE